MSDHLPILAVIKCEILEYHLNESRHVAWNKCSYEQLSLYRSTLEQELEHINLSEQCCAADVDLLYENIVNAIHIAANDALPHSSFNKHAKPYWTPEVSAAHTEQRNKRGEWIEQGRPRQRENAFFASYKESKSRFRKLQKAAIANVELKYYIDLDSSATCDIHYFWHLVNRRRKIKSSNGSKIKSGNEVIKYQKHSQPVLQACSLQKKQVALIMVLIDLLRRELNHLTMSNVATTKFSAVQ